MPEQVSVAMSEIAEGMSEGLLALAVGAGLRSEYVLLLVPAGRIPGVDRPAVSVRCRTTCDLPPTLRSASQH